MSRKLLFFALAGAMLASACGNQEPVVSPPTPTFAARSLPAPTPTLQDFVLEGVVQEVWTVASTAPDRGGSSTTPAASGTASPHDASVDDSPAAADKLASGAVTVQLTSYFSDQGCSFKPDDLVVVRITPRTTLEPAELLDDEEFPENLGNARVTIDGALLEPGPHCVPVAESITLLEEGPTTGTPRPTATPRRPRQRARTVAPPSPTPSRAGPAGAPAVPGGSNTGASSTGSPRDDDDDDDKDQSTPHPDEETPDPDDSPDIGDPASGSPGPGPDEEEQTE